VEDTEAAGALTEEEAEAAEAAEAAATKEAEAQAQAMSGGVQREGRAPRAISEEELAWEADTESLAEGGGSFNAVLTPFTLF